MHFCQAGMQKGITYLLILHKIQLHRWRAGESNIFFVNNHWKLYKCWTTTVGKLFLCLFMFTLGIPIPKVFRFIQPKLELQHFSSWETEHSNIFDFKWLANSLQYSLRQHGAINRHYCIRRPYKNLISLWNWVIAPVQASETMLPKKNIKYHQPTNCWWFRLPAPILCFQVRLSCQCNASTAKW